MAEPGSSPVPPIESSLSKNGVSPEWHDASLARLIKSGIEASRLTFHDQNLYENTELLFQAMAAQSKQRGAASSQRGAEDLRRFAQYEVQVTSPFLQGQEDA